MVLPHISSTVSKSQLPSNIRFSTSVLMYPYDKKFIVAKLIRNVSIEKS